MRGTEGRIPAIQGLRAIAVVLVVLFHAGVPGLSGGYVGVDVFFVISGFLITGLIVRELEQSRSVDMLRFYVRRIRRLAPAALLVFTVTAFVVALRLSPWERWDIARAAIASVLYVSNIWFAGLNTDYFADASANPYLHSWSLSVEEQFYLFWPWLIVALFLKLSRRGLVAGIAVSALCSLFASLFLTAASQPWAFFSMPTRIWEFALGALVYLWHPGIRTSALGAAGLGLIVLAAVALDQLTAFPGYAALLPSMGAAMMLLWVRQPDRSVMARALNSRPAAIIGDASYAWYLWHWPVLVLSDTAFAKQGLAMSLVAASMSLALALLTLRLVENPIRYGASLRHRAVFASWFALSGLAAGIMATEWRAAKADMASPAQAHLVMARSAQPRIYSDGCHADIFRREPMDCIYGDGASEISIALIGDSHAAHWFPALEAVALRNGWRLISLTKSGCPAVSVTPFNDRLRRTYEECEQWRELAFQRIEKARPSFVLLGSKSTYKFAGSDWGSGLRKTVQRIEKHAGHIFVLADVPLPGFDVPVCLGRPGSDRETSCSFSIVHNPMHDVEREHLKNSRALYLDFSVHICPAAVCKPTANGEVIYSDSNHLSAAYSASLAPQLAKVLASVLAGNTDASFAP